MSNTDFDPLKLENQLCFPLYAASRIIIRAYQPILEKLDITYPQYLVLMVLWEYKTLTVKEIGKKLLLNSNTLTPLIKRLIHRGLLTKHRSKKDERVVHIQLTQLGIDLKKQAQEVPEQLFKCLNISVEEYRSLKTQLEQFIESSEKSVI